MPEGRHKFVFTADPPNPAKIPVTDVVGVTVILITCAYRGQVIFDHSIPIFHFNKMTFFNFYRHLSNTGGFQSVDLIITEIKDHMTCYIF